MFVDLVMYLFIVVGMVILFCLKNYLRAVALAFKLPGPPTTPFFGNVLSIKDNKTLEYWTTNISQLYPPIMRAWLSIIPIFVVYEPEHLQIILSTNKYTTKSIFYTFLHNLIGPGLVTYSGEKWKQHRKLIQPCFHVNTFKEIFDGIYDSSCTMVQNIDKQTDINIVKYTNKFVLDMLHKTVLGVPLQDDPEQTPFRMGHVFMKDRVTRPWLLFDILFKATASSKKEAQQRNILQEYTKNILDQKKKIHRSNDSPPTNFLEMMLEISKANPEFTEDDIIDEACTFMLAGQDSVGAALAFSLYFLGKHPHIQDKVVDELNFIFKGSNRAVTFEDVCEMHYLEQCVKETLRLCPTVPLIARRSTVDLPLGKHVLPKGTNILISPFATHRLPHIFPRPLEFDPDRFSPENKTKIHPYSYIPFSAGPRNCIGYKLALIELKTVISEVLRKYKLSLTPGYEELNFVYSVSLKARKGIWLRLQERAG